MSVYRRHKRESGYTQIDNYVFRDKTLSLKAKGLLTQIYSLPDDWDYSVRGLVTLFKDGKEAVNNALQELVDHGYIIRTQKVNAFGRFEGYDYDIYERPQNVNVSENPITENPITENPITENSTQLNTNISNTKVLNTKDICLLENSRKSKFIPPTVEEVRAYCEERAYCLERNNGVDPEKFVAFYTSNGWKVGKNPMKNWKAAVITWEKKNREATASTKYYAGNPFDGIE